MKKTDVLMIGFAGYFLCSQNTVVWSEEDKGNPKKKNGEHAVNAVSSDPVIDSLDLNVVQVWRARSSNSGSAVYFVSYLLQLETSLSSYTVDWNNLENISYVPEHEHSISENPNGIYIPRINSTWPIRVVPSFVMAWDPKNGAESRRVGPSNDRRHRSEIEVTAVYSAPMELGEGKIQVHVLETYDQFDKQLEGFRKKRTESLRELKARLSPPENIGQDAFEKAEEVVELTEIDQVEVKEGQSVYVLRLKNAAGLPKPIDLVQFGDVESKKIVPETQTLKDGIVSLAVEFETKPDFKKPGKLLWTRYDLEMDVVVK